MVVRDLMTESPVKCGSLDSISECAKLMYKSNVGYVVVQDDHDHFIGVVTDRDIVCGGIANDMDLRESPVTTIIEREFRSVYPDASVKECLDIMAIEGVRRLPVMDGNELVGVISIDDIIQTRAAGIDEIAPIFAKQLSEPRGIQAA